MSKSEIVHGLFKSLSVAYIISIIFVFLMAILMFYVGMPEKYLSAGIIFTYIIANFFAGKIIGKKMEHKRYLWGILVGIIYACVIIIISLAGGGLEVEDVISILILLISSIGGGMFGGMFS